MWATGLENADLRKAILSHTDFTGAKLRGADLRETIELTQWQIDGTSCGDFETKLPEDINPPAFWKDVVYDEDGNPVETMFVGPTPDAESSDGHK